MVNRGLSIQRMADLADVSYCTVYRLLNGTLPRIRRTSWDKLQQLIGVPARLVSSTLVLDPKVELPFSALMLICRFNSGVEVIRGTRYQEGVCHADTKHERCHRERCPILKGTT